MACGTTQNGKDQKHSETGNAEEQTYSMSNAIGDFLYAQTVAAVCWGSSSHISSVRRGNGDDKREFDCFSYKYRPI